jgi:hypothetical protein
MTRTKKALFWVGISDSRLKSLASSHVHLFVFFSFLSLCRAWSSVVRRPFAISQASVDHHSAGPHNKFSRRCSGHRLIGVNCFRCLFVLFSNWMREVWGRETIRLLNVSQP